MGGWPFITLLDVYINKYTWFTSIASVAAYCQCFVCCYQNCSNAALVKSASILLNKTQNGPCFQKVWRRSWRELLFGMQSDREGRPYKNTISFNPFACSCTGDPRGRPGSQLRPHIMCAVVHPGPCHWTLRLWEPLLRRPGCPGYPRLRASSGLCARCCHPSPAGDWPGAGAPGPARYARYAHWRSAAALYVFQGTRQRL